MSVVDTLEFDPQRVRPQGPADTRPAPGFLDTAAAAFRYVRDDQTGHTDEERQTAYGPVVTALKERGYDPRRYVNPYGAQPVNYDAVWQDIAAARRSDPDAFKEIGDRAAFESGWRSTFAARQARDAQTMERGGLVGQLAGGLVGSLTDPVNVDGMVLTGGWGGTSVAGRLLAEAGANAGIELLETPLTAAEREKQGRRLTAEEIAMNVGFAAAGGAAFKGLEIGAPKALAAGGRAAGRAGEWTLDQLPTDLQAAVTLRRAKPDFAMTPDEMAALHVVTRGSEIDAANPFSNTYEGLELHAGRIDQTIAAMSMWPQPTGPVPPPRMPTPPAAPRAVGADFDSAWRAIIGIEGGTNRDGSFRTSPAGAIGPAQVMPGTAPEAARLAGLPFDERRYRSDAAYNQALGQAYYREMLRQFDGDAEKAAAAYNAGPGSARKGTGVRGAMERARRAGVPNEWVSFLPAETRKYVANFRRRAGGEPGQLIELADGETMAPPRSPDLDAERPLVERSDFEIAQGRDAPDLPELRRDLFASDTEWRAAQATLDGEAFGVRSPMAALAELPPPEPGMVRMWRSGDGANGGWFTSSLDYARQLVDRDGTKLWYADVQRDHEAFSGAVDMQGPEDGFTFNHEFGPGEISAARVFADSEEPATAPASWIDDHPLMQEVRARRAQLQELDAARLELEPDFEPHVGDRHTPYGKRAHEIGWHPQTADEIAASLATTYQSEARIRKFLENGAERSPAARDEIEADGGTAPAVADVDAGKVFDDPTGDPVARVADLAWHDAQRAAAARQAPEQLTFDLGDGKGERTIADIEAELKADEDAIAAIEGCLVPAPAGAVA